MRARLHFWRLRWLIERRRGHSLKVPQRDPLQPRPFGCNEFSYQRSKKVDFLRIFKWLSVVPKMLDFRVQKDQFKIAWRHDFMMMAAFLCNFSNARPPRPRLDFIKGTKRIKPNVQRLLRFWLVGQFRLYLTLCKTVVFCREFSLFKKGGLFCIFFKYWNQIK